VRACGPGIHPCGPGQLVPDDLKVMKEFSSVIDGMNHGAGTQYDVFDLHPEVRRRGACCHIDGMRPRGDGASVCVHVRV
jgi:hypothetical protein